MRPLRMLGYVWAAPTTLACLVVFLLPMWALRQAQPGAWRDGAWEWTVTTGSRFSRWCALDGGWGGTTLGCCILLARQRTWCAWPCTSAVTSHRTWSLGHCSCPCTCSFGWPLATIDIRSSATRALRQATGGERGPNGVLFSVPHRPAPGWCHSHRAGRSGQFLSLSSALGVNGHSPR